MGSLDRERVPYIGVYRERVPYRRILLIKSTLYICTVPGTGILKPVYGWCWCRCLVMPRFYRRRRPSYGFKRSFKSRGFKTRRFTKKRYQSSGRSKALTQRRYAGRIERALKVEYKVGDVAYASAPWSADTGGDLYPFIGGMVIAQGMAARDRFIGNQICIKGLHIGITFSSGTTATAPVPVTIALVRSRNRLISANVNPAENDIFDMGNITSLPPSLMVKRSAAGAGYTASASNLGGAGSYGHHKLIWLHRFVVPAYGNVVGTNKSLMLIKKTFKMNTRCVFNNVDSTRNSVEYTLMCWSDLAAAATTQRPQGYVYARMVYTDL